MILIAQVSIEIIVFYLQANFARILFFTLNFSVFVMGAVNNVIFDIVEHVHKHGSPKPYLLVFFCRGTDVDCLVVGDEV